MRFFRNRIQYHGQATKDFDLIGYLEHGSIKGHKYLTKIGDTMKNIEDDLCRVLVEALKLGF